MATAPQSVDHGGTEPLRLLPQRGSAAASITAARERRLSLAISALVAAITAAGLGLLIATTADAARSAAADHTRAQVVLAQQDAQASVDTEAQLSAYRDRLQQAYDQLQVSYATLQQRDAAYQQALQVTEISAANLQTADQTTAAKLADAYQQLQQANAQIQQLQAQMQSVSAHLSRSEAAVQSQSAAVQAAPAPTSPSPAANRLVQPAPQNPNPAQQIPLRRERSRGFDD